VFTQRALQGLPARFNSWPRLQSLHVISESWPELGRLPRRYVGMKRLFTIAALSTALLAGPVIAQAPAPDSSPVPTRSIKITAEQGYIIKENVAKAPATSGQGDSVKVEIGGKAPNGSSLQDFPQIVVEKVPAVKSHKFFVSNGEVVVVDPKDNTIADIIK